MARVGPNQDINDPTTLNNLRSIATSASLQAKYRYEILNNESPTGGLAIPIFVELKLSSGQSVFVSSYQLSVWEQAVINTYIYQPERFRNYWRNINSYADNITAEDIETVYSFNIEPPDCDITYSNIYEPDPGGSPVWRTRRVNVKDCFFEVSLAVSGMSTSGVEYDSLSEPIWKGIGPTNYNYNTFPQLQSEFGRLINGLQNMNPAVGASSSDVASFHYNESTYYIEYDTPSSSRISELGVSQLLNTGIDSPYLFIYNPTIEDIQLNLSGSLTVTPGSPDIFHFASKQIAVGSNQAYKSTSEGDTYQEVDDLGGTFSDNTIITIPSKTSKGINFPILFSASAYSTWTREEDRIPENSLSDFLCKLELEITIQGQFDNISFTPSVSI